jgi:hypothetical protein
MGSSALGELAELGIEIVAVALGRKAGVTIR